MYAMDRIADLWPHNTLTYRECHELCVLIDRNHAEHGLRGTDRERMEVLVARAEANEPQRPLDITDLT